MAEIIYVLTNEYMPGLVKIGMTQREDVQARINELSRHSGVPVAFTCHYAAELPDGAAAAEVEKILHQLFGDHRVNLRKEFFKMDAEKVVLALRLARAREVNLALPPAADVEEALAVEKAQNSRSRLRMQAIGNWLARNLASAEIQTSWPQWQQTIKSSSRVSSPACLPQPSRLLNG